REDDEEERDAVDPELPGDAPRPDPDVVADELEAGHARVELVERVAGRHEYGDGDDEAQDLDQLRPPAGHGEHEGGADGGQDDERGEDREAGIPHRAVLRTTKAKRATVPAATPRA